MSDKKIRLLVDAMYISGGGGLVLLNYFIKSLTPYNIDIHLLIDSRNETSYDFIPKNRITVIDPSIWGRHKFYVKNKRSFDVVFTVNNLPPSVKLPFSKVYTYFHQYLFLNSTNVGYDVKMRINLAMKRRFISMHKNNVDYFVVQTLNVKNEFHEVFKVQSTKILVYPFFEEDDYADEDKTAFAAHQYLYVSDGHPHKNHSRLLQAWEKVNTPYPQAHLTLTVSEERYPALSSTINAMNRKGINVSNAGFQDKEGVVKLYKTHKFLVYPSLTESFGLGLIEAARYGCEIIAADLYYVHAVVNPLLLFDPKDADSIANSIIKSIETPRDKTITELRIKNQIQGLIEEMIFYETMNKPMLKNETLI